MNGSKQRRPRLSYENRLTLLTLCAGAAPLATSLVLLWTGEFTPKLQWTLTVFIVACWAGFAAAVRSRIIRPLQTVANLMAALREGDFSVRAVHSKEGDVLDGIVSEINTLADTLHEQRLGALEATALLRTVMAEIDVAVFAFDEQRQLRLINRAGERLLAQPAERLTGLTAERLNLVQCLSGQTTEPLPLSFPGGSGRWGVRVSSFRQGGRQLQLLVLTDLTRPLRAEEVQAWKRLVRVLGHELNNSLTPIKSIAGSLQAIVDRDETSPDWREDLKDGLSVIGSRAESLSRFMSSYAALARLPEPKLGPMDVGEWVRRVANLETRLPVELEPGPEATVQADEGQLDQLLINLIRNAADASLETNGKVRAGWRGDGNHIEVWIEDEGPGLSNTANLFVPFFTTKPGGAGIGLALSRQIAENHNGAVTLENRGNAPGCIARLRLPASFGGEIGCPKTLPITSAGGLGV